MARVVTTLVFLLLLAGCTSRQQGAPKGTITGTVTGMTTAAQSDWGLASLMAIDAPFVPGEVIVGFGSNRDVTGFGTLSIGGMELQVLQELSGEGTYVYDTGAVDPRVAAATIATRPDVLYAHPNYILQVAAFPSEPYQYWNFEQIKLKQAWEEFTGTAGHEVALQSVVVAVVDTGILFDPTNARLSHGAFDGVVLEGYDFIRDPTVARDGDARDADPYDPGDNPQPSLRTYHGTHVAGTIGALEVGTQGIYGVAPTVRILPVRVLGYGGGSIVDIFEGAKWAAGLPVPGVPTLGANERADIINMSLTGAVPCSPYAQGILDEIAAAPQQPIVVVAAGNDGEPVGGYTPAGCANVLTVGASIANGQRAAYSNTGAAVDILAPGGVNQPEALGVPSTGVVIHEGVQFARWVLQHGTSMAAPHVSGVLALMRAIEPGLTLDDALFHLESGASPAVGGCATDGCGVGVLNAENTLKSLIDGSTMSFALSHRRLEFHPLSTGAQLTLTNREPAPITVSITGIPSWLDMRDQLDQLVHDGDLLTLAGAEELVFVLEADIDSIHSVDDYHKELVFADVDTPGYTRKIDVFAVSLDSVSEIEKALTVYTWVADDRAIDGWRFTGSYVGDGVFSGTEAFELVTEAADNLVIAWVPSRLNHSTRPRSGDWVGAYPSLVPVAPSGVTSGIHIQIEPRFGSTSASDPLQALLELWGSHGDYED